MLYADHPFPTIMKQELIEFGYNEPQTTIFKRNVFSEPLLGSKTAFALHQIDHKIRVNGPRSIKTSSGNMTLHNILYSNNGSFFLVTHSVMGSLGPNPGNSGHGQGDTPDGG